ncbi:MAG: M12 family metallo-peptidase, partial [Thermofilaceae archaeon]
MDGWKIGTAVVLNLFSDRLYTAVVDRVSVDVNGVVTLRARVNGSPFGYFLVSTSEGRSLGDIRIPEKNEHYIILSDRETRKHFLLEIAAVQEVPEGPPLVPPAKADPSGTIEESRSPLLGRQPNPNTTAEIDLLVVYTPAARDWADEWGGGLLNVIAQAIEAGQLALDNSETSLSLTLSRAMLVTYTESGDSLTDLLRLTFRAGDENDPSGYLDEVHDWRDLYGGDLVVLLARVEDVGGLGWLLSSPDGSPEFGFSLVRVQQAGWTYTFIHELGHNLGCHHHKEQKVHPGPGIFSYSAGWRWVGNDGQRYCCLMTYGDGQYFPDGQTHTPVAHFSNPSVLHKGVPTGHEQHGDNARTIRETKHAVAAYRGRTTLPLAVTTPGYDNMGAVLETLGRQYTTIHPEIVADLNAIRHYATVFVNCGWGLDLPAKAAKEAVRQYVYEGGVLYASDWAYVFIAEAFPEYVQFAGKTGAPGQVDAYVTDHGLATYLGTSSLFLQFDLPQWVPVESTDARVRVYVAGEVTYGGQTAKKPVVIGFEYGRGKVIYTAFHHAAQDAIAAKLMEYLALVAFSQQLARQLEDVLTNQGYEVVQDARGFVGQDQVVTYQYVPASGAGFRVGLNWPSDSGATLKLSVYDPNGSLVGQVVGNKPPIWVDVPGSPALPPPMPPSGAARVLEVGTAYSYTVTGVAVPAGQKVEYAVAVGVSSGVTNHVIIATAGPGGTISPSGEVTVPHGGSQTFTITPDTGYKIKDVLVDGSSVGAVSSYTFQNVTADHTIHATFEAAVFYADFEDITGWTMTGLWRIRTDTPCINCPTPASISGAHAYYGRADQCSYDIGARTMGILTSPVIEIPANTTLTLQFDFARHVEYYTRATRDRT